MKKLKPDWNSYGAAPPTEEAINNALIIVDKLDRYKLVPDYVTADACGGVAIVWHREDQYIDFECDNSGDIYANCVKIGIHDVDYQIGVFRKALGII
jgi:hypothetical protein